ncbi:MAG: EAL domain-containing protein [Bryobacterales bacterium]|nr:EAL domain-containing protein [Bryobacterales bacterium]
MELPKKAKPGNGELLLLVDDDPDARESMQRRLNRRGYNVVTADGGPAALELIGRERFELLLLDHNMPVMTGLELLQLLRGTYSQSELPIVMLTAQADSEHLLKAFELGANDYLTKPVDFEIAMVRIASQLARRQAEMALRESEQRYQMAMRGSNDGLWDWDLVSNSIYFSTRWKGIAGYTDAEITSDPSEWWRRVHPADEPKVRRTLRDHLEGALPEFDIEHRLRHKDDSYHWVRVRGVAVRAANGEATRIAGSLSDINDQKVRDPLTGLANRLRFEERLAEVVERYHRDRSRLFAAILIDLDRFKLVNDSLGHPAGDDVLRESGRRIEQALRRDLVGRLGGDEFAVLVENIHSEADALSIGERLVRTLAEPFDVAGCTVCPAGSAGIAIPTPDCTAQDLIRNADIALYRAKQCGRGRAELFNETMQAEVRARVALESDLRLALDNNQFEMFYQPKVDLRSGEMDGLEALIRWRHPVRGLVPPAAFIPLAEETGLILPIGRFVIERVAAQLNAWRRNTIAAGRLHVAVNLSARQLKDANLLSTVKRALVLNDLPPETMCLEVTESAIMDDAEASKATLRQLKDLGVRIQIDDFGTGYSSLAYISQFPLDGLKIDRSFIQRMMETGKEREIVRSILSLGHATGLAVVAEGVETAEQVQTLLELGCREVQGYFYSPPVEAGRITRLLESGDLHPVKL